MTSGYRVYAVLGAHRSGTSWLAGSLEEKGLELGEVNTAARYNQKGNRESERLWHIHEDMLRASGGSWREPPARVVPHEPALSDLRTYVAEMNARHERWGFKDPRSIFFLDLWRELVPDGIGRVGIYRHPAAVADSLTAREPDVMDSAATTRLWLAYNERLVREHQRDPFPILRFDIDPGSLLRSLDAIAHSWDLSRADAPSTFFASDLRHSDAHPGATVPAECGPAWDYLERAREMSL